MATSLAVRVRWKDRPLTSWLVDEHRPSLFLGPGGELALPVGAVRFTERDGHFTCTFSPGVVGRRHTDAGEFALTDLVADGTAVEAANGWSLPVGEHERVGLSSGALTLDVFTVRTPARATGLAAPDYRWLNVLLLTGLVAAVLVTRAETLVAGLEDDDRPHLDPTRLRRILPVVEAPPPVVHRAATPEPKPTRTPSGRAPPGQASVARVGARAPALAAARIFSSLQGLGAGSLDHALDGVRNAGGGGLANAGGLGGLDLRGGGGGGDIGGRADIGRVGVAHQTGTARLCVGAECGKEHLAPERLPDFEPTCDATGCLDKKLIRDVIHQHLGQLRACYERSLARAPSLDGRLVFVFRIEPSGEVSSSKVKEGLSAELDECIVSRVRTWRFPASHGGGATVSYPLVFHRADQ
jgi:hypothetical protein